MGLTGDKSVTVHDGQTSSTYGEYRYAYSDREALIALYNSTDGDNWTNNSGWKEPPLHSDGFAMPGTEYGWYGIIINWMNTGINRSFVERIELGENNLKGTIPQELVNLRLLERLHLYHNQLWGCIPKSLGNCTGLSYFNVYSNELSGEIPAELMNLTNLHDGFSNFAKNHLYSTNEDLKAFLAQIPCYGGDWERSQTFNTNIPRVEPSENCGVYAPCFDTFQEAFAFSTSPSVIFAAEGEYWENIVIEDGDTLVLTWDKEFSCRPPSGPVILSGPLP